MASKLDLFNAALLEIEMPVLSALTETGERRRTLDAVYDRVVEECLASGSWNFATETVKLSADTGVEPAFGMTEIFAKPADWIRTVSISADENFTHPETEYEDEENWFSASTTPIYAKYVSNDTGMGLELVRWTQHFTR